MKKSACLILAVITTVGVCAGCNSGVSDNGNSRTVKDINQREMYNKEKKMEVEKRTEVENKEVTLQKNEKSIIQTGFFTGLPENGLAEFEIAINNEKRLRIFEVNSETKAFLKQQDVGEKSKFTIIYKESGNGITNPIIMKLKKI